MADSNIYETEIGELRGAVINLEKNFNTLNSGQADLSRKIDEVFRSLTTYFQQSSEKTEARIDAQRAQTDARFEANAATQLASLNSRGNNTWQIIAAGISALISLAGVGAVFWGLTKAPIDSHFATLDHSTEKIADEINDRFVPRAELAASFKTLIDGQAANTARTNDLERLGAISATDREAIHRELVDIKAEIIRVASTIVPRPENENRFIDLQYRIDKIFDRLNITQGQLAEGNSIGERLSNLNARVDSLASKFIVIPQPAPYNRQPASPSTGE